jgi:hypothetical protein
MFMIKRAIIVLILVALTCLPRISHVVAAPLEVKGETLHAQFSVNFRVPQNFPELLTEFIAHIIGQVRVQNDEIQLPALDGIAMTFYHASKGVMGPKMITDNTVDAKAIPESNWENTGILCIYDGGVLIDEYVSKTKFTTQDPNPAKTQEHRQGAEFLAATNVNYKLAPRPDDTYHYERDVLQIKIDEPLSCEKSIDTKANPIKDDSSTGDNTFLNVSSGMSTIISAILSTNQYLGQLVNWKEITVTYKGTTLNPWTAHTDCFYDGCEQGELSQVNYPVSQEIKNAGGVGNTFRPTMVSFKDKVNGGAEAQGFSYTAGSVETKTAYSFADKMKSYADGTFCALTPALIRDKVFGSLSGGTESAKDCIYEIEPTTPDALCDSKYFNDFEGGIGHSEVGGTGNPGYDGQYRSPSFQLTSCMKERAKWWAATGFSGGQTAIDNIDTYWDMINSTAVQYGWNPIFVVAVWIEESGAGGHPNAGWDLGCKFGWSEANRQGPVAMPKISDGSDVCDQMACLFSHPVKDPSNFGGFMCSYDSVQPSCTVPGWNFAENTKIVYEDLLNYQSCN